MKDLKGLRVCRTAYLAHLRPVWFRCGAVPNGRRENGARKSRPGWYKGPVGTEGEALTRLWTTESNTFAFERCHVHCR
jgi:hypothetical protein